ncbi:MAG: FxsA family protein [Halobacteriota archaeon]
MLGKLVLAFVLLPFVDLYLLLVIAGWIGVWETLALVVVTGVVGGLLARQQGVQTLRRLRYRLGRGESPSNELVDGALIVFGAALLVTPGVLTDVIGFLLLVPPSRVAVRGLLRSRLEGRVTVVRQGGFEGFEAGGGGTGDGPRGPGGGFDVGDDGDGVREVDDGDDPEFRS